MASKEKVCIACKKSKPSSEYRRGQYVCKMCEEDPTVVYEKECNDCKEMKSNDMFTRNRVVCKDCERRRKNPSKEKLCIACNLTKSSKDFRRGQSACKSCEEDPDATYEKECRDCKEKKSSDMFRKNRKTCLDCERSFGRDYRRTTTKAKDWVEQNKERMTELQSRWYEENKERIRQKEYARLKTDKKFVTVKYYRASIGRLLCGKAETNKRLAIDRDQYIHWLEFCFRDGMTLENHHDVWHIDHVLPLDLLYDSCKSKCIGIVRDTPEYQNLLFSWYNTYPLEKLENRLKSNCITAKHLTEHILTLRRFLKTNKKNFAQDELYVRYIKLIRSVIDFL